MNFEPLEVWSSNPPPQNPHAREGIQPPLPVPAWAQGGPPPVEVGFDPDPVGFSDGDPMYGEPKEPGKHPLEESPYCFLRAPGIGFMGGDGPEASSEAWLACTRAVREYDDKLIQSWRGEMNTTLVFAALFSAIVAACVLESYQWLKEDPQDQSVALLTRVTLQLERLDNRTSLPPATPFTESQPGFSPSSLHIATNALWFSSLVITLHAVLMAILVKQWLTEYTWTIGSKVSSPHQTATLRQLRFEGLTTWKIPQIITYLPTQLILALFLFLGGLLCVLWDLHVAVAIPATILVALSAAYLMVTSVLPSVYPTCGYRSAQAWLVHRTIRALGSMRQMFPNVRFKQRSGDNDATPEHQRPRGWTDAALQYLEDQNRRIDCDSSLLTWIYSSLTSWDRHLISQVWSCALDSSMRTTHSLIRQLVSFNSARTSSTVNALLTNDLEKNVGEAALVPDEIALSAISLENSICSLIREDTNLRDGESYKLYHSYSNGLFGLSSVQDNTFPSTNVDHVNPWDSSSDIDLLEYITVFRVLHFHLLPSSGAVNRVPDDLEGISRGTRLFASLLDENTIPGTRIGHSEALYPLRRTICDDLQALSRKNWQFLDMEVRTRLQLDPEDDSLDSNLYLPAQHELDALISTTLSQYACLEKDPKSDIFVSLVETALFMSRRIEKERIQ
ncbi:hypothetical protein BKA70DRAFT_1422024 [Coprinopsis sp. MPI-PUGE-AT-0042]|nr:hypothetical protein BKA70DRAFT_1422024 [Coprinopsis sp. MPI-PUGE-AT-0042]